MEAPSLVFAMLRTKDALQFYKYDFSVTKSDEITFCEGQDFVSSDWYYADWLICFCENGKEKWRMNPFHAFMHSSQKKIKNEINLKKEIYKGSKLT